MRVAAFALLLLASAPVAAKPLTVRMGETWIFTGNAGASKSCAVPAKGRLAMEHWKQHVTAVRLSDFKPAPAGSLCP